MSENSNRNTKPSRKPAESSRKKQVNRSNERNDRIAKASGGKSEASAAHKGKKQHQKPVRTKASAQDSQKIESEKKGGKGRKRPALSLTNYATMRLNKYLANAGICSRREADELIKTGLVEVDGKVVTEMGYQVKDTEVVKYAGEKITPEMPAYFLLNKPKNYASEMKLTADRKSALTLLKGIGKHSVAPIGKMDRTTSGLMLYTNDGSLAIKLGNPKGAVKKIYHVHLDKNLKKEDMNRILEGVEIENRIIKATEIAHVGTEKDKKQIGIALTSNRNKAVRLLFKALGYYVIKLDRVMFAGLTKKDLPRGKWRPLTEQELINLKMMK